MDTTLTLLRAWMPQQRWYAAKGRDPQLRRVAQWHLESRADARVSVLLVQDAASDSPVLYQIPLVERSAASAAGAVIGALEGATVLVDGAHDPAFTDALYTWVTHGGHAEGIDGPLTGEPLRGAGHAPPHVQAKVLSGEQSNTSIIYGRRGHDPAVICKLFRQVSPGLNPDIELQTALAEDGSRFVPDAVGAVEGVWRDPGDDGHVVAGSLAFAQRFFPGVEDAWRVALRAADAGEDFTAQAAALGRATADVHSSLARLFPTHRPDTRELGAVFDAWRRRLEIASREVPGVAELAPQIRDVYERTGGLSWPDLQRVHGDYHLGQVLHVPDRGWVLLDFEGEPLRPIVERTAPDVAVRDVAGMLRSFDYVAGSLRQNDPEHPALEGWAEAARTAFLTGYAESTPPIPGGILRAFELDKAVYEAIYETRNRPDWVGIPLAAIERLL